MDTALSAMTAISTGDAARNSSQTDAVRSKHRHSFRTLNRAVNSQIIALLRTLAIAHMQVQNHTEAALATAHFTTATPALRRTGPHVRSCWRQSDGGGV